MKLLCLLFLSLPFATSAQILVQGSTAASKDYHNHLLHNPALKSYADHLVERMQSQPLQEQQLFALADLEPRDFKSGFETLERINQLSALSPLSQRFLRDLAARWKKQTDDKDLQKRITSLQCKMHLLDPGTVAKADCDAMSIDLSDLKRQHPTASFLAIESRSYSLETNSRISIASGVSYHFTILSNSHEALHVFGSTSHLMQHPSVSVALIEGSCEGFTSRVQDIEVLHQGWIFFDKDCSRRIQEMQATLPYQDSWLHRNKRWLYPAAAALVVGGGLYALKDKTLVIDTSSIK